MAKYELPAGTTSYLLEFSALDITNYANASPGFTGLVYNSSGITCYYIRKGQSSTTSITLAAGTLGTYVNSGSAGSGGGLIAIDATNMPGAYQLSVPNLALGAGATAVIIWIRGVANMADVRIEIELTANSNQDAVRGGMTALPNNNAEAAGGLYTRGSGAGQINQNANGQVDTNLTTWKGTAPASLSSTFVQVDAEQWKGGTIPAVNVTGVPKVDLVDWLGSAPDALSSGKIAADLKLWLATAPLGLSSQLVQGIVAAFASGQDPVTLLNAGAYPGSPTSGTWGHAAKNADVSLPFTAPAAALGLPVLGTNTAGMALSPTTGTALALNAGTNGHGMLLTGNGTGSGLETQGGNSAGSGINAIGGTGGQGISAIGDPGGGGDGIRSTGYGSAHALNLNGGNGGGTGNSINTIVGGTGSPASANLIAVFWAALTSGLTGVGSIGAFLVAQLTNAVPTASTIATSVWSNATRTLSAFAFTVSANVTQWLGTAAATPDVAGIPKVEVASYASAKDPATLLLITPANLLATDSSGRVTAASVTGAVGSVTGNVGGSVGSVTSPVTVGTNNDKTGYALSTAGVTAIDTELSGVHGAGAWGPIGSAGTFTITITVEDANTHATLQSVLITIKDSLDTTIMDQQRTSNSGVALTSLNAATFTVHVAMVAGYSTIAGQTLVVTGNQAVTYYLTPIAIPSPPAPGLSSVVFYAYLNGVAQAGYRCNAYLESNNQATSDELQSQVVATGTTDSNGRCILYLIQTGQFTNGTGVYNLNMVASDGVTQVLAIRSTIPDEDTVNVQALIPL